MLFQGFLFIAKNVYYSSLCHKRESVPRAEANMNAFPAVHWCACVHAALFQKYPFFALQPNSVYVCHTYKKLLLYSASACEHSKK